jgi:hypothetical protein
MKYLKKYQLFESKIDDDIEKINRLKQDYDNSIEEIKKEYDKFVSDCLYDLTDTYDFTKKVTVSEYYAMNNSININDLIWINYIFKVPIEKKDEFINTLSGISDLIKNHLSEYKDIKIQQLSIFDENDKLVDFIHIVPLEHVKTWIERNINEKSNRYIKSLTFKIQI